MFYLYDFNERKEACSTVISHFQNWHSKKNQAQNNKDTNEKIKEILNRILMNDMHSGDHELLTSCLKYQKDSAG